MNATRKGTSVLGFFQALEKIDLNLYCVFFTQRWLSGVLMLYVCRFLLGGEEREEPGLGKTGLLVCRRLSSPCVPTGGRTGTVRDLSRVSSLMSSFPP